MLNLNRGQSKTTTEERTILENLTSLYGMKQSISTPTHILQHSTSCIDLFFVNQQTLLQILVFTHHCIRTVFIKLNFVSLIWKFSIHHLTLVTKTSEKDHSLYNTVCSKNLILWTSTSMTLKIICSRNVGKNLFLFINFPANTFLLDVRKNIYKNGAVIFLSAQELHSWSTLKQISLYFRIPP